MSTPSDIPGARVILGDVKALLKRPRITPLEQQIAIAKIDDALAKMTRAPPVSKAAPRSRKMTPELAAPIKDYHRLHPGALQQEIAVKFGVTAGRVSEALNGLWDEGAPMWRKFNGMEPLNG